MVLPVRLGGEGASVTAGAGSGTCAGQSGRWLVLAAEHGHACGMVTACRLPRRVLIIAMISALAACADAPIQRKDGSYSKREFSVARMAKGDIDEVVEAHQRAMLASLKALALKFYKRNPREYRKDGHATPEAAVARLFEPLTNWEQATERLLDWESRLRDAWRADYAGDRVAALMQGLVRMGMASYGDRTEFYMLSQVDPQKFYNSARNIEAVAWKVANARDSAGELVLVSNSMVPGQDQNLSFEREFGKLIATQDTLAMIIEDKSSRVIRTGVVNVASMLFLPI